MAMLLLFINMMVLLCMATIADAAPSSTHSILMRAERCLECRSLPFGFTLFGFGYTPLEAASRGNLTEVVRSLLLKGARLEGSRAVHYASYFGYKEVMDILLEKGPELVHSRDKNGRTPLHWATTNGHVDLAFHLLNRWKANIAATDVDDYTPIHFARIKALWKFVDQLEEFRKKQVSI